VRASASRISTLPPPSGEGEGEGGMRRPLENEARGAAAPRPADRDTRV